MGIRVGASELISVLCRQALYNREARRYNVCVDGEYMRFKGMNSENMSGPHVEESVASTSVNYLIRLVKAIQEYLPGQLQYCYVYMDGARQEGKVHRAKGQLDIDRVNALRASFISKCRQRLFTVIELTQGEAELQMYIQRDKTVPLNVFVTNDSDMMTICYGHLPTLPAPTANFLGSLAQADATVQLMTIVDPSYAYPEAEALAVRDSCVWFNACSDKLQAVGFDGTQLGLNANAFRCLVYLCGTDYSEHILTQTMIRKIVQILEAVSPAGNEARTTLNALTDPLELAAIYMFLALRGGATARSVKPAKLDTDFVFEPNDVRDAFRMFSDYVTTGTMGTQRDVIPQPSGMLLSRELMYALHGRNTVIGKTEKAILHKMRTLADVLRHFRANFVPPYWIGTLTRDVQDTLRADRSARRPTTAVFSNLGPHLDNTERLPDYRRPFVIPNAAGGSVSAAPSPASPLPSFGRYPPADEDAAANFPSQRDDGADGDAYRSSVEYPQPQPQPASAHHHPQQAKRSRVDPVAIAGPSGWKPQAAESPAIDLARAAITSSTNTATAAVDLSPTRRSGGSGGNDCGGVIDLSPTASSSTADGRATTEQQQPAATGGETGAGTDSPDLWSQCGQMYPPEEDPDDRVAVVPDDTALEWDRMVRSAARWQQDYSQVQFGMGFDAFGP